MQLDPILFAAADVHAPSSNTAAIVTYAAETGDKYHMIRGVVWSYSADPTSATLKIEDGSGTVVWGPHYITKGGPGEIWFGNARGSAATALIITLAAGGSGISGVLTVIGHRVGRL